MRGGEGNDTIYNPGGSDALFGEGGNDIISNSADRGETVFMFVGSGNNEAKGSASDDNFFGDATELGSNKFIIDGHSGWFGKDTVRIFNPAKDKLYIGKWFAYEWDNVIVKPDGPDLYLARDDDNYVKLVGVTLQELQLHHSVADLF